MEEVNDPVMDLEMQLVSSQPAENHGGCSSATRLIHKAILVIQCLEKFLAGANQGCSPVSRARYEDNEEVVVECVNSEQTAPLLKSVDNASHSRKPLRKLIHVLHSIRAFKAHEALATAYDHCGSSGTTEGKPEVAEASDSLATPSEHHVTSGQLTNNEITANQSSPIQTIKTISTIVRQKDFLTLTEFGGLRGVEDALCIDSVNGISEVEALNRRGQHVFSPSLAPTHTFLHFVWEEVKKKTILLLLLGGVLSTVFEIIQDGLNYGCYAGVVVLIAIILITFFASIRKYWQEQRAQKKLQNHQFVEKNMENVHVKRGGEPKVICKSEIVWGDILSLRKGDEVPCDGLFVGGEPLELDYGSECCIINQQNPFLSYGERVINGEARMLVTSTNMGTEWGEMMSKAISDLDTRFKLETQLDKLNIRMHYIRIVMSILIILVLFVRYMVGKLDDHNAYRPDLTAAPTVMKSFANTFRKIITESSYTNKSLTKLLCVSLVGLTEGVPFIVSVAIVYWNHITLSGKATEQDPHGVAKMAHVTQICTDTFVTEDEMEVEKLIIGGGEYISGLTTPYPIVTEVIRDGISILKQKPFPRVKDDKFGFKSEMRWKVIEMKGAKSFEEPCGVLMRGTEESEELVWHFNGPVNEILNMCKHYYDKEGQKAPLDDEMTQIFVQANQDIQDEHKLTTIAFACKPVRVQTEDVDDLIFIGLLGLKNKNRDDTDTQVKTLRDRRIETVIVSSKKISVLKDIARKCEVVTNDNLESLEITGEVFRKYTNKERLEKVDNIRVLGEALPSDKLLLVETMREKGRVVAFLGQRTDEAPALKRANIGIAMGTWSCKKAIENCDIIMDGRFEDLISMVDSGKCIYQNIQSFLQIVLITNISSTLIGFIETAIFGDASLTIFQLAWVNLAVAILGGVALLTKADKPVSSVPISCEQSFITGEMRRNILFQVSYQAICSVIIQLKGSAILGPSDEMTTVASNIFILSQLFNIFNAREIQKKNFFRGIHRHKEFWVATALFIVLHAAFVMGQDILGYGTQLKWKLWAGCVLLGAVSWLVDWLGKCIWWFIKILVNRLRKT
ncbi:hypothetical protein L1987_03550 [Smallanthus sonchifolius]|uniref:Uncharacterized protein n=1 Tax=Smallanthus sonchifolius TaxID=185202 RepID=A0ACB9KAU9_9ASTR|nr:hypothetical protein L1987_03550 [Smallanthus sonchifolius]